MSNDITPPSTDAVSPITPQISRFPNPIPTTYQGAVFNAPLPDQTEQEKLSQEIAEELDNPIQIEKPLPVFNR